MMPVFFWRDVDVGGGSVANATRHSLARISLRWMIRHCFILKTDLLFHRNQLKSIGLEPDTLYLHVLPRPLSLSPKTSHRFDPPDQLREELQQDDRGGRTLRGWGCVGCARAYLKLAKGWWVLECLGRGIRRMICPSLLPSFSLMMVCRINVGRVRIIPKQTQNGIKVNWTVKIRMEAEGFFKDEKYEPGAEWEVEPLWVD